MNKKIVLASASPRRKDLLNSIGLEFEIIPSEVDENIENEPFSHELIQNIALDKVLDTSKKLNYPAIVIGSDTVVVVDDKILGKPKDNDEAFNMLTSLSGKTHTVISAIVVYDTETKKLTKDSVTSQVTFREIDEKEVKNYINTGETADKAGAYAIQGKAGIFVKEIKGCYSNIVGISVYKVSEILKEFGVNLL